MIETMSDSLVPGILAAMADGRTDDAAELADALVENSGGVRAVLVMATYANLLHRMPSVSLQQLAAMVQADDSGMELNADHLTNGVVMEELLDVLAEWDEKGGPSERGAEILRRFDLRPGSAEIMRTLCGLTSLLMANMKLQMGLPLKRSPDAAQRYAIAHARAVARQEQQPNVFSAEWNDEQA